MSKKQMNNQANNKLKNFEIRFININSKYWAAWSVLSYFFSLFSLRGFILRVRCLILKPRSLIIKSRCLILKSRSFFFKPRWFLYKVPLFFGILWFYKFYKFELLFIPVIFDNCLSKLDFSSNICKFLLS